MKFMKKIRVVLIMLMLTCILTSGGCMITIQPDWIESNKQTLTFVEAKFYDKFDDKECVGLFFDYANDTGESKNPGNGFVMAVHQNGKLLDAVWVAEKVDGAIGAATSAPTGTTRVVWLFILRDKTPLFVEISDGQKFTIKYEEILKIK